LISAIVTIALKPAAVVVKKCESGFIRFIDPEYLGKNHNVDNRSTYCFCT